MKTRYRLIRRGLRGGIFYCMDTSTGKRTSLQTGNEEEAQQIINAKNQAIRQPALNLQIAKAYLAGSDSGIAKRTWQNALDALTASKRSANRERWQRAGNDKAYDIIRHQVIIETDAEVLLKVLRQGTVSTNIYLRRLHNFCLDMDWLLKPIIPRRQWPKIHFKEKRAITWEEHQNILAGESNAELRDYYEVLWHLGGSQTDVASLRSEDIDWANQTLSYARMKTGSQVRIRIGEIAAGILRKRPTSGYLFPQIVRWKESDRAKAFSRRCRLVGVAGISLHSYRYAWAERARSVGYWPRIVSYLGYDPFTDPAPGRPKGNETHGVAFSSPTAPHTLGQKLINRRLEQRKNQLQCAAEMGVSIKTYSAWELGRRSPSKHVRQRISFFLGCDLPEN